MSLKNLSNSLKSKPTQTPKEELGIKIDTRVRNLSAVNLLEVKIPLDYVEKINNHIDNVIIPQNEDYSGSLVGQINRDKKSAQLGFPLDTEFGKEFKKLLDVCGTTFLQNAYKRESAADAFQCWTVHSFAGDYNVFHSHSTMTMPGLSCILFLKIPDGVLTDTQITHDRFKLQDATGHCDGWTQFIWGSNTKEDIFCLKPQQQEFCIPSVGKMVMFPKWLHHQVYPFFSDGERRTLSANFNIRDSENEKFKYMTPTEKKHYLEQRNKKQQSNDNT